MLLRRLLMGMVSIGLALGASAADLGALLDQAKAARRTGDTEGAKAAYEALLAHNAEDKSVEAIDATVRAALTYAELLRYQYAKNDHGLADRRELGNTIDKVAEGAHEMLNALPESAEKYRIKADLYGTMIRTKYQGKKFADDMDEAVKRALELDDTNASAWVTVSKRLLFAPERRGGDIEAAFDNLDRAVELDPKLEQAWLLRGMAQEKLGDIDAAKADYAKVIELNPDSIPAKENLERAERGDPLPEI